MDAPSRTVKFIKEELAPPNTMSRPQQKAVLLRMIARNIGLRKRQSRSKRSRYKHSARSTWIPEGNVPGRYHFLEPEGLLNAME